MTWLGRDALGRVTDFTAESSTSDSNDPPDITVGGGAVEQTVLSRTVTLTDAQIKALPSTGVEIIPAPGSGKMLFPLEGVALFQGDTAYTNIDAEAGIGVLVGGFGMREWKAESILNWNQDGVIPLTPTNASAGNGVTTGGDLPSTFDNQPVVVAASNLSGDFTGGNAANTLKITVLYTVVDL